MNVFFTAQARKALDAKMAVLRGRGAQTTAQAIALAVEDGNRSDRMQAKDRYGQSIAALRRPRSGKYKGATGMPLVPFGSASRVIANFRADARRRGGQWVVIAGWINVTSDKGIPFLPFHFVGAGRLPVRAIDGVSPKTWVAIREILARFTLTVAKTEA